MTLIKKNLWGIVSEQETALLDANTEQLSKFVARSDQALAMMVLSIEPSLLYIIGDSKSPVKVWKRLSDHFQKKSWGPQTSTSFATLNRTVCT